MVSELPDDRMIQDQLAKNPMPAWTGFAIVLLIIMLLWESGNWFYARQDKVQTANSFLQVTNRQFSLFLWQFTEFMKVNVSAKTGYLPDFYFNGKVTIDVTKADHYVALPPKILFLYHTWRRLVNENFAKRPILANEFQEFLEVVPEWKPQHWPEASKDYASLVNALNSMKADNIAERLPLSAQQAFIGWKNFFIEGEEINRLKPTYQDMREFLKSFPMYARSFWRNLLDPENMSYLLDLQTAKADLTIPNHQLAGFLKVAFFNETQAKKQL